MASNKNQHFVPRCYLKEFTHGSENKAINVFNIDRKKFIPNAPVKNQCSKDYFYGQDEKLEEAIQFLEGSYASMLREVVNGPKDLSYHHKVIIKRFWLFQYLRTEAASKRAVEMSNDMTKTAGISSEDFNLEIKEAVQIAMRVFAESMDVVDDLKICLLSNKTKIPFVTSDDPAVLTNRWHLNDHRTRFGSFGLSTCGDMFLLPLTPKIICVGYDGDVYSIPQNKGWACIDKESDVKAFNQHQFLNCRANVFFKHSVDLQFVEESYEMVAEHRPSERHRIHYAVFDYNDGQYSRYKVIDPSEAGEHERAIIHSETVHSRPLSWPTVIRWRNRGSVYTNGTGLGYVRKGKILPEYEGFYKEPVKLRKTRA